MSRVVTWMTFGFSSVGIRERQASRADFGVRRVMVAVTHPGLQHEHVPQMVLPAATAGEVFLPTGGNGLRPDNAVGFQALLIQQIFRPIAQRSLQPLSEW